MNEQMQDVYGYVRTLVQYPSRTVVLRILTTAGIITAKLTDANFRLSILLLMVSLRFRLEQTDHTDDFINLLHSFDNRTAKRFSNLPRQSCS